MADIKPGPNQILIANDLLSGRVVYLSADGTWAPSPSQAHFARTKEEADALLAQGLDAQLRNTIVGPELIVAEMGADGPVPTRNREVIRMNGPTMHTDHGYQAQN